MLERQEKAAFVGAVELRKEFTGDVIAAPGRGPSKTVLVIDGADRLAHILEVESSGDRFVLRERRANVLVIRKRVETAVVRAAERVLECARTLENHVVVIRDRCDTALAAHLRRSEKIVEIRGVQSEANFPRDAVVVDLEMQPLALGRDCRC